MPTMQAISLTAVTEIRNMTPREIDRPEPSPTQVVLKMTAAGVNPMDWESASGPHAWVDAFPHTLGNEGSGVVAAVGSRVQGFQVGDVVLAYAFGASPGMFAQYNAVEAEHVALLPQGFDASDWAASPIGLLSVYHAFYKRGLPQAGTGILIEGTGGVGQFAIPWAKKLGLRVSVLATARSASWAKELGADHVFSADLPPADLEKGLAEASPQGYDIIFSTIGLTAIPRLAGFLAKNGRFISTMPIQSPAGQELSDLALLQSVSMRAVFQQNTWEWFLAEPNGKDLSFMLGEARRWGIRCPVAHRYPLAEASTALMKASGGGNRGKVLLDLSR